MFTSAVAEPVDTTDSSPARPAASVESSPPTRRRRSLLPMRDMVPDDGDDDGTESRFPVFPGELEKDLVRVFKLLSDRTRLRILLYLAREGELHVSAMCERLGQSQPAVSHHLALLRNAEIIEPRRDGKHNFYSIRQQRFVTLLEDFFSTVRDPETDAVEFDDFTLSKGN